MATNGSENDEFTRIYGDCAQLPLTKALADIVCRHAKTTVVRSATQTGMISTDELHGRAVAEMLRLGLHQELRYDARKVLDLLLAEYDATFGPRLDLVGDDQVSLGEGYMLAFCFDENDEEMERGQRLHLPKYFGEESADWENSGFNRAARSYQRECGWDFPPGESGVWLAYCLPTDGCGGKDELNYGANLAGFLVLHDRDEDGNYESLAHVWTAKAVRNKNIGKMLVTEARRRFPVRQVEWPVTKLGTALFRSVWPECLEDK
jgi:ribosomal protein S18 acetylase RimI-like enzyme